MRKLFPVLFLAACATSPTTKIDDLVGKNISEAIDVWGYPDNTQTILANKIYQWRYSEIIPLQALETSIHAQCTRTLETNQQNIITKWETKGNNCGRYH